jgi:uncharacterized protein YkvS
MENLKSTHYTIMENFKRMEIYQVIKEDTYTIIKEKL